MYRRRVATLALGLALGCGHAPVEDGADIGGSSSAGGSQGAGGSATMLRGRCAIEERLGGFELTLEPDFSTFNGAVYDKALRSAESGQVGSDGACSLMKTTFPSCDPSCAGGKVCVQGGRCEAPPASLDLGAVIMHGLTAPLTMHAVKPGNRYFSVDLPHPPAAPSRPVRLQAEGGPLGVLQLRAEGVAPLVAYGNAWRLERGKPLEIEWKAPHTATQAKVRVTLKIDQHGSTPVTLVCQAEDSGTLTISSKIIGQLLDSGISGHPSGDIYREVGDQLQVDGGCVDLAFSAHREQRVELASR